MIPIKDKTILSINNLYRSIVSVLLSNINSVFDGMTRPNFSRANQEKKQSTNIKRFGLVSLFNGISTFVGDLMPILFS